MKKEVNKIKPRTRDLAKSRKEILDAGFHLVFNRGFQGVSVDEIVSQTSLTKGAFYHQFPTKLELGYALLQEVITPMVVSRWITPLDDFKNPIDGILHQLQKNIGDIPTGHLKLGCPLNNLVQEMSPLDKEFKKLLTQALHLWIEGIEQHIQRGKEAGFIRKEVNSHDVAQFVVMAHEGFYGLIKGTSQPDLFPSLMRSLKLYFSTISS